MFEPFTLLLAGSLVALVCVVGAIRKVPQDPYYI